MFLLKNPLILNLLLQSSRILGCNEKNIRNWFGYRRKLKIKNDKMQTINEQKKKLEQMSSLQHLMTTKKNIKEEVINEFNSNSFKSNQIQINANPINILPQQSFCYFYPTNFLCYVPLNYLG